MATDNTTILKKDKSAKEEELDNIDLSDLDLKLDSSEDDLANDTKSLEEIEMDDFLVGGIDLESSQLDNPDTDASEFDFQDDSDLPDFDAEPNGDMGDVEISDNDLIPIETAAIQSPVESGSSSAKMLSFKPHDDYLIQSVPESITKTSVGTDVQIVDDLGKDTVISEEPATDETVEILDSGEIAPDKGDEAEPGETKGGFFDDKDEDEVIALSGEELGNILEDVDEDDTSPVIEAPEEEKAQTEKGGFFDDSEDDDDEIIALSDEELINIMDDVDEVIEAPEEEKTQTEKGGFFDDSEDDDEIIALSDEELGDILDDVEEEETIEVDELDLDLEESPEQKETTPEPEKTAEAPVIEQDGISMENPPDNEGEDDLTLDLDSLDMDIVEDEKDTIPHKQEEPTIPEEEAIAEKAPDDDEDLTLDLDSLDLDFAEEESDQSESHAEEEITIRDELDLQEDLETGLDEEYEETSLEDPETEIRDEVLALDASEDEESLPQEEPPLDQGLAEGEIVLDLDDETEKIGSTEEVSKEEEAITEPEAKKTEPGGLSDELVEDILEDMSEQQRDSKAEAIVADPDPLDGEEDLDLTKETGKEEAAVSIIEDEEQFVKEAEELETSSISDQEAIKGSQAMPSRKELKKMITYLDRLFNNLPDKAVKKFAKSEYFDLYISILSKLEIS